MTQASISLCDCLLVTVTMAGPGPVARRGCCHRATAALPAIPSQHRGIAGLKSLADHDSGHLHPASEFEFLLVSTRIIASGMLTALPDPSPSPEVAFIMAAAPS